MKQINQTEKASWPRAGLFKAGLCAHPHTLDLVRSALVYLLRLSPPRCRTQGVGTSEAPRLLTGGTFLQEDRQMMDMETGGMQRKCLYPSTGEEEAPATGSWVALPLSPDVGHPS